MDLNHVPNKTKNDSNSTAPSQVSIVPLNPKTNSPNMHIYIELGQVLRLGRIVGLNRVLCTSEELALSEELLHVTWVSRISSAFRSFGATLSNIALGLRVQLGWVASDLANIWLKGERIALWVWVLEQGTGTNILQR